MKEETKLFGIQLPKGLYKQFKMMCVDRDMQMREGAKLSIEKEVEVYMNKELNESKENENSLLLESKKDFVNNEQLTI